MRWGTIGLLGMLILAAAVSVAFAGPWQGWRGSGGWGNGGAYQRMFDPATMETLSGEVLSVDSLTPLNGMGPGIHLMVRSDVETISVHLGPAWYIGGQDVRIETGDTLGVTGSRIEFQGKPAIIASEVKKGDEVLKLRDERGIPVWSGWRRSR